MLTTELMCAIRQADVGLNLYDFHVRAPGQRTRKYKLRVYDDVILASYVSSDLPPSAFPSESSALIDAHDVHDDRLSSHPASSTLRASTKTSQPSCHYGPSVSTTTSASARAVW